MKRFLILGLILLAACSTAEPTIEPQEIKPETREPEVVEPIVIQPETTVTHPEPEDTKEYIIPATALSNISCEGNTLTLTLTNTAEKTWSLDVLSFPPPKDVDQLKVTINSYDAWNPGRYFTATSLRDCTGGRLQHGDSVVCVLSPVPTITENAYSKNSIQVQANQVNQQKTFACT